MITKEHHLKAAESAASRLTNASDDLLSESEVAAVLKLAPGTLRNWRSLKVGPPWTKLRRAVRYRREDLNLFIASGMAKMEAA